jgi:hypothetical protein
LRSFIDQALKAHPEMSSVVEKLVEPATRLDVTPAADLSLGASRIGGVPDLPPSMKWPELAGSPFQFVAQIRLDEILPPPADLPASGMLWFFVHWRDPDHPEARVLFHENPEPLIRHAPEYPMRGVSFSPTVSLPGPWRAHPHPRYATVDGVFAMVPSFAAYQQYWWDMIDLISSADDFDWGAGQLLGAFPDDGDESEIRFVPEERLLLWLCRGKDEDDLYFVIPKAALAAGRFDSVRAILSLL